jgi:N6-L-threonylcarbamoyladenine synthase
LYTYSDSIVAAALSESGLGWDGIDAIAVTYGPGLSSSLLAGLTAAKALALRLNIPLIGINHCEAHVYSIFLGDEAPRIEDVCPYLTLLVSGGHTSLIRVRGLGDYQVLGQTMDDAAGEAFDKGANLMNLGFPGGPIIDKTAKGGDPKYVNFPRGRQRSGKRDTGGMDASLCFSFSGLKTALLYYLRDNPLPEFEVGSSELGVEKVVADIAASYQEAIVDALVTRCKKALGNMKHISVCGGVSLNSRLRVRLSELAEESGVTLICAEPRFCADNAAMIAGLAGVGRGIRGDAAMELDATPSLPL